MKKLLSLGHLKWLRGLNNLLSSCEGKNYFYCSVSLSLSLSLFYCYVDDLQSTIDVDGEEALGHRSAKEDVCTTVTADSHGAAGARTA